MAVTGSRATVPLSLAVSPVAWRYPVLSESLELDSLGKSEEQEADSLQDPDHHTDQWAPQQVKVLSSDLFHEYAPQVPQFLSTGQRYASNRQSVEDISSLRRAEVIRLSPKDHQDVLNLRQPGYLRRADVIHLTPTDHQNVVDPEETNHQRQDDEMDFEQDDHHLYAEITNLKKTNLQRHTEGINSRQVNIQEEIDFKQANHQGKAEDVVNLRQVHNQWCDNDIKTAQIDHQLHAEEIILEQADHQQFGEEVIALEQDHRRHPESIDYHWLDNDTDTEHGKEIIDQRQDDRQEYYEEVASPRKEGPLCGEEITNMSGDSHQHAGEITKLKQADRQVDKNVVSQKEAIQQEDSDMTQQTEPDIEKRCDMNSHPVGGNTSACQNEQKWKKHQQLIKEHFDKQRLLDTKEQGLSSRKDQHLHRWNPQVAQYFRMEEQDEDDNVWQQLRQLDKPLGRQEDDQGRLFCVMGSPSSVIPRSSRGRQPMLQLVGVTLDSSSDDVSLSKTHGKDVSNELSKDPPSKDMSKDVSMDSGIQGSSCDLADTDAEDSGTCSAREGTPGLLPETDAHHSETFNLVEEVYVVENAHGELSAACVQPRITPSTIRSCCQDERDIQDQGHFVVVAIDFGTTYSGYAFCFTRDPDTNIHVMRKWEGGDPGLNNQKTPTTLLLTPDEQFHSFGFAARDFFHDMDIQESKKWLFFDKFKMSLHHDQDMNRNTQVRAANGQSLPAITVFAHALRHLKCQALQELSDQAGTDLLPEHIRWVITVPAIWRQPAKQFIREAGYQAGICDPNHPEGLLIALEPEAASICCRKLQLNQLIPEHSQEQERRSPWSAASVSSLPMLDTATSDLVFENTKEGTRYMVVDCGGGTVDITVHELSSSHGTLRELHKATGGPWGSMGVDIEFEHLLADIFGEDFLSQFKLKCPAAYIELLVSFEARKRSVSPCRDSPLNIFPPFAFIDYYRKLKGKEIEQAVRKFGRKGITWSSQGTLRLQSSVMRELFSPTVDKIIKYIRNVLDSPRVDGIQFLFLVGGFAESQLLQYEVRKAFSSQVRVIIPQGVALTILRGAVLFGLEPGIVTARRSKYTYGVGVLKHFIPGVHPPEKLVEKDGVEWCTDVLDKFVQVEQSVSIGETVVRRYTPARPSQTAIVINIYCANSDDAQFITDPGVHRCGTLKLDLSEDSPSEKQLKEIHTRMVFGGTEVTASALDIATGKCVQVDVDFLAM